jgi:hypothetical protein
MPTNLRGPYFVVHAGVLSGLDCVIRADDQSPHTFELILSRPVKPSLLWLDSIYRFDQGNNNI